jgi:hypothetical protein
MAPKKVELSPAFTDYNNMIEVSKSYTSVKAVANHQNSYLDIESGRSVRPQFGRSDYNAFRPNESVPSRQKHVIKMCMDSYDNVGIIRNVIDLMADFGSQGMTIVHPNKTIERFYRRWFEKIGGFQKTERFLNYLYRTGNPIVRRGMAKITPKQAKNMKKASAGNLEEQKVGKREIPWSYEFLNPLVVDYDPDGQLMMNITNATYQKLLADQANLPEDIRKIIASGKKKIPLSPNDVRVFHYKKDDWLLWANPMVRPILDDVVMLEKMKLADIAALDGAISNVRLWNIGDLEYKIMPKKAIVDKLRDILASNVGGGTIDLIWGPDLKFTESNSQVYKFLGAEKYGPVLTSIYGGLGIPLSLTGAGGSTGYTNNYVALKALIERLEYGRQVLLEFWNYEFKLVQQAMGFSSPAKIHFDTVVLSDEASVKAILMDMWDRNIISTETIQERLKENPEVEQARLKKEFKDQLDPEAPKKASPFHNPQHIEEMAQTALQSQQLDGHKYFERLGLPYQEPPKPPAPAGGKGVAPKAKPKKVSSPTGGRPVNKKDKVARKTKVVKPKTKAVDTSMYLWAMQAQKDISDLLTPFMLKHFNKKNIRSLTKAQFDEFENLKLSVLVAMKPYSQVNETVVGMAIDANVKPSVDFHDNVNDHIKNFMKTCERKPSVEELRTIYAITFAEMN